MLPFAHATRVMIVDDDQLFLDSFEYAYHSVLNCVSEANPQGALETLSRNSAAWSKRLSAAAQLATQRTEEESERWQNPFQVVVEDPARTDTISVVIVDFAMPNMSGIDFCRAIRELPARKIMLTGQAKESTAIAAFNDGLIDCFLTKQDADLPGRLLGEVGRLQTKFFRKQALALSHHFNFQAAIFAHEQVSARVRQELEKFGAVEHYFWNEPCGVLFADQAGKKYNLVVFDKEAMRTQLEVAEICQAPQGLVERFQSNEAIAWFPTRGGYYEPQFAESWKHFIASADIIDELGVWLATFRVGDAGLYPVS